MKNLLRLVFVLALAVALTVPAQAAINKATITVESSADSAGQITFNFRPEEGAAREIAIQVEEGTSSSKIAKEIQAQLSEALGDGYKVKMADQKVVTITRKGSAAKFQLTKSEQTVEGTKVYIAFS
jgi:hypothetical protein